MIVTCPKCHFENKAETAHVVCARCATLIEIRNSPDGAGAWNPFESQDRMTRPVSVLPTSPTPLNGTGRRDPYATRIDADAEEVLDIPRYGTGIYPSGDSGNVSGNVFDDVLPGVSQNPPDSWSSSTTPLNSSWGTERADTSLGTGAAPYPDEVAKRYSTPEPVPFPAPPPALPVESYSRPEAMWAGSGNGVTPGYQQPLSGNGIEQSASGWPVLPEDSTELKGTDVEGPLFSQGATAGRNILLPVLLTVLVFAGLGAAAWYFIWPRATQRETAANVNVAKPGTTTPAKTNAGPGNSASTTNTAASATGAGKPEGGAPLGAAAVNNVPANSGGTKPEAGNPVAPNTAANSKPDGKPAEIKTGTGTTAAPATAAAANSGSARTPISVPVASAGVAGKPAASQPAASQPTSAANQGSGSLTLQIGSFSSSNEATQRANGLKSAGIDARVVKADVPGRGTWHRVHLGRFRARDEASRYASQLKARGAIRDFLIIGYQN